MISHEVIRTLAAVDEDPGVSIYLPVHAALPDRSKNAIRLRKLMREAGDRLRERGADPDTMLSAARRAFDPEPPVAGRATRGLAIFITGGNPVTYALPGAPPEHVAVRRGLDLLPLVPFVESDGRFFVLALDRDSPVLYRGTRLGLETIGTGVMEQNLKTIRSMTELPNAVNFRSAGRGGSGRGLAVSQAYGDSAGDYEQIELDLFARGVARAAEDRLKSETAPLVPAGEPNLLGMFRKHCRYAGLTDEAVTKSPGGLDADELFRAALGVVDEDLARPVREAVARVAEGHNRDDGSVALTPATILEAAAQGRVGTLLLARDGTGGALRVTAAGAGEERAPCDRILAETLRHGGAVLPVGPDDLPAESAVAALFRF